MYFIPFLRVHRRASHLKLQTALQSTPSDIFKSLTYYYHFKSSSVGVESRRKHNKPRVRVARSRAAELQWNKRNPTGVLNFLSIKCQFEPCCCCSSPLLSSPLPLFSLLSASSVSKASLLPFTCASKLHTGRNKGAPRTFLKAQAHTGACKQVGILHLKALKYSWLSTCTLK